MSTDVKMGVVGCGSIAEIAHFPAIAKRKEAKLVAVCDIDAARAQQMAAKWGAEHWFTDYRKMYEKVKLDAVVIATPEQRPSQPGGRGRQRRHPCGGREAHGGDQ